jgi:carbon storage regulator
MRTVPIKEGVTMLVLSRKAGDQVHIGNDITFTVLGIQGNRVRIGIVAPAQVPIVRGELCRKLSEPLGKKDREPFVRLVTSRCPDGAAKHELPHL